MVDTRPHDLSPQLLEYDGDRRALPAQGNRNLIGSGPVKVTGIETIRWAGTRDALFVQIHTDVGLSGLGETSVVPEAVEAYVHETVAPYLIGREATQIELHAANLREVSYVGNSSAGVEARGNSAIDIALWDLLGKRSGQDLTTLLGGSCRDGTPAYSGVVEQGEDGELGRFLSRTGISVLKVRPFAELPRHTQLTAGQLNAAVVSMGSPSVSAESPVDLIVDLESRAFSPDRRSIRTALRRLRPIWLEDPFVPGDIGSLRALSMATTIPICGGQALGGQWSYRQLIDQHAVSVIALSPTWCGGITEARSIAALAKAHNIGVVVQGSRGAIGTSAAAHLSQSTPNVAMQEVPYRMDTADSLFDSAPTVHEGRIRPPSGPGIGVGLRQDWGRLSGTNQHLSGERLSISDRSALK